MATTLSKQIQEHLTAELLEIFEDELHGDSRFDVGLRARDLNTAFLEANARDFMGVDAKAVTNNPGFQALILTWVEEILERAADHVEPVDEQDV